MLRSLNKEFLLDITIILQILENIKLLSKKIMCFVDGQDFLPALLVSDSCLPRSHKAPH